MRPQPRILMCPPTYYGIEYEINPWMSRSRGSVADVAHRQWQALHDALIGLGVKVELMTPQPGLPDLVFTANAGLMFDKRFFSDFRNNWITNCNSEQLFASLIELSTRRGELGRKIGGRGGEVVAPLDRGLGKGRIGVVIDVGDAGPLLLDRDLAVEIDRHVVKVADHGFDIGDLAALFLDFEAFQADQCVA